MDNLQKTAIKETAKAVGAITGLVFLVSAAIALLSLQAIATILVVYCLGVCIKMIYNSELDRATRRAELNNTVE